MNTKQTHGTVDVLGWFDDLIRNGEEHHDAGAREARAAVAALIEANRKIAAIYGPLSSSMRIGSERREAWGELFAAIARAKGGA